MGKGSSNSRLGRSLYSKGTQGRRSKNKERKSFNEKWRKCSRTAEKENQASVTTKWAKIKALSYTPQRLKSRLRTAKNTSHPARTDVSLKKKKRKQGRTKSEKGGNVKRRVDVRSVGSIEAATGQKKRVMKERKGQKKQNPGEDWPPGDQKSKTTCWGGRVCPGI